LKRRVRRIDYIQRSVDLGIVYLSWISAYLLKFTNDSLFSWYAYYGVLLLFVSTIVFKNSKVYDSIRFSNISKEIATQLKANGAAFVTFLVLAFFTSNHRVSRVMLVIYFVMSSALLIYSKYFFRKLKNKAKHKILMIGKGKSAQDYHSKISNFQNFEVVNWVNSIDELDIDQLESMHLDDIIIGFDTDESDKASKALNQLSELLIPLVILPDVSYAKVGYSVSDFKGQPLIYINEPNIKQTGLILKRLFDFSSTLIGGILISPILITIAIIVKATSKGPIFYSQERMGVDGKTFKMWKFRSMVTGDANHEGWTVKNDPRVTRIGKIIRSKNLDELPQLWNVLIGDMSLIGPRPERPQYVEQFRKEIPGYMIRHKFKAGVTGWAQVNGWRGDTSIKKRIDCDLWYIKNWSFWLDITILFMTFFKGNKNAY
jgi:exopolysaccharide biosynthesis polyprenyl glycosylphosphotransferase